MSVKTALTAFPVVAMAAMAACDLVMPEPRRISVSAEVSTFLYTDDTLVVRRTISNGERDTLWLDVSPLAIPYSATDLGGNSACLPPAQTAVAEFLRLAPGQSVSHERLFPMSTLTGCEPGIYTMRIHAQLFRDDGGRRQAHALTWAAPSLLVREVPPPEP